MTTEVSATAAQGISSLANAEQKTSVLTSDFETFLTMLTAQAKYQDPLEPIDSTEYASQLAQFSMVEQQVQTNDALAALSAEFGLSNMASLANWVGMDARAEMPAYFDGGAITVSANPATLSDRAELVVHNASGVEIDRQEISLTDGTVDWNGYASGGTTQPWGSYSFSIDSFAAGELIQSSPAEIYDRVTEAQAQDGQIMLIFSGGQSVASSAVTGLRQPQ